MPLSRERNRERMRAYRVERRAGGTALVPRAMVRRLKRLGVDATQYLTTAPVSLDDYSDLERRYEAKVKRVEWQSGGIRMLMDEVATLKARLATQAAMEENVLEERVLRLETDQVLREAILGEMP